MKDKYKVIFELVSPARSDDDFIREVRRKAEISTMKKFTTKHIYALTAAVIMVVGLSAAAIFAIGGGGDDNFISPLDTDTPVAYDEPLITITPDESDVVNTIDVPVIDPANPYNFAELENPLGLDVRITDIFGDEDTAFVTIEVRGPGVPDFPNSRYTPNLILSDRDRIPADEIDCVVSFHGSFNYDYTDDGVWLMKYIVNNPASFRDLEFNFMEYESEPVPESYPGEYDDIAGVSVITNETTHYRATFSLNYEPAEMHTYSFYHFTEAERNVRGVILNEIMFSEYSFLIYFDSSGYSDDKENIFNYADYRFRLRLANGSVTEIIGHPTLSFYGGDGVVYEIGVVGVVGYEIGVVGSVGYEIDGDDGIVYLKYFYNSKYAGDTFDIADITAIIIDGVEFELR